MGLMNMRHYEQQNLEAFQAAFLSLNADLRNSAKYFEIPSVVDEEELEFMFHADLLGTNISLNVNECIQYKWSSIEVAECALFDGFEIYSNEFGGNSMEFDDCWGLCAKYSSFYQSYALSLKLVKMSSDINGLRVKCKLCVADGDENVFAKMTKIDIGHGNNMIAWDEATLKVDALRKAVIDVEVEVVEVFTKHS